jgi:gamma-glutamyl hercynylcysteine S-oxide synthase
MAATASQDVVVPDATALSSPRDVLAALDSARRLTLELVAHLSDRQLERAYSPIMSPLVWDLAHIAAYEDLWLAHRHADIPLLRPDLAELYDAFETPREKRGEIELLGSGQARAYMADVRERVIATILSRGVGDGFTHEMVVRHELQHTETMRQAMAIAGLLPPGEPRLEPSEGREGWLQIPAGSFAMGAGVEGFAYDNERPRHLARTEAFRIACRPVSNASWMRFSEGGGYERREWWSDEGWAWKEEYDITHHPSVADGHPQAPVCHVSWFEADAFARAHAARLPSEAEWERAATWDQVLLADRRRPTAAAPHPTAATAHPTAATTHRTAAAAHPTAAAGTPRLSGVGQAWEWTSSAFHGYPGFLAHPYREYSEVFFGEEYRVLRGGSWATSKRVATPTFRNWDLPQRRQIFAGVRLAKDVIA